MMVRSLVGVLVVASVLLGTVPSAWAAPQTLAGTGSYAEAGWRVSKVAAHGVTVERYRFIGGETEQSPGGPEFDFGALGYGICEISRSSGECSGTIELF